MARSEKLTAQATVNNARHDSTPTVIIGGGISGLSAAFRLAIHHGVSNVTVLEARDQVGGTLQTRRRDQFLIERSADSFLVTDELPYAGELVKALGMADQLIEPSRDHRRALIVRDNRLLPVPQGFQLMAATKLGPLLRSPALPFSARVRAALEPLVPRKISGSEESEETVTEFISRRIGRQAFEFLAQPLVGGIYAADPDRLSAAAAIPQYVQMEQDYGSVSRGLRATGAATAAAAGARYGKFKSLRHGMQSLVERLESQLREYGVQIQTGTTVTRVARDTGGWTIDSVATAHKEASVRNGEQRQCGQLLMATSASCAARLLADTDQDLADALTGIPSTRLAVVSIAVRRCDLLEPLSAFGLVVPRRERRPLIAASFSSVKFSGRAPADEELIRVFLGGAMQPDLVALDDAEIERLVAEQIGQLLDARAVRTLDICRWTDNSPQYQIGHCRRVARIETASAQLGHLAVAGSALAGVGLPQCIRSGFAAADRLLNGSQL